MSSSGICLCVQIVVFNQLVRSLPSWQFSLTFFFNDLFSHLVPLPYLGDMGNYLHPSSGGSPTAGLQDDKAVISEFFTYLVIFQLQKIHKEWVKMVGNHQAQTVSYRKCFSPPVPFPLFSTQNKQNLLPKKESHASPGSLRLFVQLQLSVPKFCRQFSLYR